MPALSVPPAVMKPLPTPEPMERGYVPFELATVNAPAVRFNVSLLPPKTRDKPEADPTLNTSAFIL